MTGIIGCKQENGKVKQLINRDTTHPLQKILFDDQPNIALANLINRKL